MFIPVSCMDTGAPNAGRLTKEDAADLLKSATS
jgi:hypothetical protein